MPWSLRRRIWAARLGPARGLLRESMGGNWAMADTDLQLDINPPRGEKGDFQKVTVTLPPDIYTRLIRESARRKIANEPNQLLSALLREAVLDYLKRLGN